MQSWEIIGCTAERNGLGGLVLLGPEYPPYGPLLDTKGTNSLITKESGSFDCYEPRTKGNVLMTGERA